MIRAFDWRDVRLVRRLTEQGVCLDAETCYTRGWHSLQSALLGYLAPGAGTPTFVWHGDGSGGAAFGQMQHRPGDDQARLLFLAPACPAATCPAWEALIERFIAEAGERSAHNLIANVNDNSDEFDVLRRLGFAIYARQDIWRLSGATPSVSRGESASLALRAKHSADAWGIQTLYGNVVPRLVQQVEAPPPASGHGFVLEEDGEIVALLEVSRGPLGVWCEPFLHPEAYARSAEVVRAFLRLAANGGDRPILFCVRSYQDWLHEPLAEAGFEPAGEQAVMVKRLAVRLPEVEPSLISLLERSRAEVTSPLVKSVRRN